MPTTFVPHPEAESIGTHLTQADQPHAVLQNLKILYVGKDRGDTKVHKASPLWKMQTQFDAVVEINVIDWQTVKSPVGFVDHLLCHIFIDVNEEVKIVKPEKEIFLGPLMRHGAWSAELEKLAQQLDIESGSTVLR